MNKETGYINKDAIIEVERSLTTELFALNARLAKEPFYSVCEQMEVAIRVGELGNAIKSLRQARSNIMNAIDRSAK